MRTFKIFQRFGHRYNLKYESPHEKWHVQNRTTISDLKFSQLNINKYQFLLYASNEKWN